MKSRTDSVGSFSVHAETFTLIGEAAAAVLVLEFHNILQEVIASPFSLLKPPILI